MFQKDEWLMPAGNDDCQRSDFRHAVLGEDGDELHHEGRTVYTMKCAETGKIDQRFEAVKQQGMMDGVSSENKLSDRNCTYNLEDAHSTTLHTLENPVDYTPREVKWGEFWEWTTKRGTTVAEDFNPNAFERPFGENIYLQAKSEAKGMFKSSIAKPPRCRVA
tara:strand:+ start:3106 stop:3594 length:489 start_codon:yes stop_codon:yes gene_type:complete